MAVVEHDKVELDYCSVCLGVWFDRGELELLLGGSDGGTVSRMVQRPQLKVAEKNRKCPICGKKMRKIDIGSGRELVIDACSNGHGLWFDGGESGTLIRQLKLDQPSGPDPLHKALFFIGDALGDNPGTPGKS